MTTRRASRRWERRLDLALAWLLTLSGLVVLEMDLPLMTGPLELAVAGLMGLALGFGALLLPTMLRPADSARAGRPALQVGLATALLLLIPLTVALPLVTVGVATSLLVAAAGSWSGGRAGLLIGLATWGGLWVATLATNPTPIALLATPISVSPVGSEAPIVALLLATTMLSALGPRHGSAPRQGQPSPLRGASQPRRQEKPVEEVGNNSSGESASLSGNEPSTRVDVIDAIFTEQRRICADLHDSVKQDLVGMQIYCRSMSRQTEADDPARKAFVNLESQLRTTIDNLRQVTYGLSPATLEARGLREALEDLGFRMSGWYGVEVDVEWDVLEEPADRHARLLLFLIAKEAVSNAVRHGSPTRVRVRLRGALATPERDRELQLSILDNGCGFDISTISEAREAAGSLGFDTIKERAALLGGSATVASTLGVGTRVEVRVPDRVKPTSTAAALLPALKTGSVVESSDALPIATVVPPVEPESEDHGALTQPTSVEAPAADSLREQLAERLEGLHERALPSAAPHAGDVDRSAGAPARRAASKRYRLYASSSSSFVVSSTQGDWRRPTRCSRNDPTELRPRQELADSTGPRSHERSDRGGRKDGLTRVRSVS